MKCPTRKVEWLFPQNMAASENSRRATTDRCQRLPLLCRNVVRAHKHDKRMHSPKREKSPARLDQTQRRTPNCTWVVLAPGRGNPKKCTPRSRRTDSQPAKCSKRTILNANAARARKPDNHPSQPKGRTIAMKWHHPIRNLRRIDAVRNLGPDNPALPTRANTKACHKNQKMSLRAASTK